MVLFIICCVLCGIIFIGLLLALIFACLYEEPAIFLLAIALALLAAIAPVYGVCAGVAANDDHWQEPKYQELVIEHDTLCEAINNGGVVDVGIMSKVVDYNKNVAYYKAKRNNKWVGYFVDKAYERVELIDYNE